MPQLPMPFRAAVGLLASAMDEARNLPDKAIELPMLAVSTALQLSLRAQQRYAYLAARGDELLNRREPTDEAPEWAVFDEPIALDQLMADEQPTPRAAAPVKRARRPRAVPASKRVSKTVRRPRTGKPSPFDEVGDE